MDLEPFSFARMPELRFGTGEFDNLGQLAAQRAKEVLVFTGGSSLKKQGLLARLEADLAEHKLNFYTESVASEPSPDLVDRLAEQYRSEDIELVLAIGGGSVLDTGKAVSAMLAQSDSVMNYLEGVGAGQEHPGDKVPFIAVPTTAGTGSEATKNAVLSRVGDDGFKKSLRHDNFIPDLAVIDPGLTVSCPPSITAASGLDAFCQLLGAYLSTEASVLTDSLTFKALGLAAESLVPAATDQSDNLPVRAKMAYATFISGVALANAGLGIVHGFASSVGGLFEIPHGVVCGSLLGAAVAMNVELLKDSEREDSRFYLKKYAQVGALLAGEESSKLTESEVAHYSELLVERLEAMIEQLEIPKLSEYGVEASDLDRIVAKTGNKNNPVPLTDGQQKEILKARI